VEEKEAHPTSSYTHFSFLDIFIAGLMLQMNEVDWVGAGY
jgi:hypothetical protein